MKVDKHTNYNGIRILDIIPIEIWKKDFNPQKEICAFEEYLRRNPQDVGKPLGLYCPCSKCSTRC